MDRDPKIAEILERYPGVQGESLSWPEDVAEWSQKEIELFVGSGGFLKPRRARKAAKAPASAVVSTPLACHAGAEGAAPDRVGPKKLSAVEVASTASTAASSKRSSVEDANEKACEDLFGVRRGACLECGAVACPRYRRWMGVGGG